MLGNDGRPCLRLEYLVEVDLEFIGEKMPIFTVRTTVGRERTALDSLYAKLKNKPLEVKAILNPAELKGYLFIEGKEDDVRIALHGVPHVRGILPNPVEIDELSNFFAEKPREITFKGGDIVEVIGGPFKREKARIIRIDEAKREARIELVESAVPIPITINLELLKASR